MVVEGLLLLDLARIFWFGVLDAMLKSEVERAVDSAVVRCGIELGLKVGIGMVVVAGETWVWI